jgi:predicted nucleic acid-binding protein
VSVLLDTGILYAYYDRSDAWHRRALAVVQTHVRGLLVPAPVIPEVDHLLGHRLGARAQVTFYRGFTEGAYAIADLPHDQIERVVELNRRFASLKLGFVDAAVVAIAEGTGLRRIATADRRHFEPVAAALSLELLP